MEKKSFDNTFAYCPFEEKLAEDKKDAPWQWNSLARSSEILLLEHSCLFAISSGYTFVRNRLNLLNYSACYSNLEI